jgi:5,10-methylene-tetrahydrofolate dehydrogenase/methenyl tetrahydrofolate cyclohydrolase
LPYPTAAAIIAVLDSLKVDLLKLNYLVLGQGQLVGRPTAHLLQSRGYNVLTANRSTPEMSSKIKQADVLISAIGDAGFVKGDMIKPGAIVIDAGTSESEGGVAGDVDMASVEPVASVVSPVPGGVGPVTVAMLLSNVVLVAKEKASSDK